MKEKLLFVALVATGQILGELIYDNSKKLIKYVTTKK